MGLALDFINFSDNLAWLPDNFHIKNLHPNRNCRPKFGGYIYPKNKLLFALLEMHSFRLRLFLDSLFLLFSNCSIRL